MKSIVMPNPVQLTDETKNKLSEQVKETLATEISVNEEKKLTVADMWNLHRKNRSASDLMRRWNLN